MAAKKKTKTPALRRLSLAGRWELEGTDPHSRPLALTARVPGVVHWDLQRARLIPDPFEADAENAVKWVASQTWTYRRKFRVSAKTLEYRHVELVFEGLDTFAEIVLNGTAVGKTDNMFTPFRFDVRNLLLAGDNEIAVTFLSPVEEGLRLHREYESVPLEDSLGTPRPYVRKAQYSYGWDWGPIIPVSGIWRDVYLETWSAARIESVYWRTLKASAESARVEVIVDCEGTGRFTASAVLADSNGRIPVRLTRRPTPNGARFRGIAEVENPRLWWPAGQGGQDLYEAEVAVESEGKPVARHSCQVGLRTVNLKRQKDDDGETFIIEVNGREIFCKGADWIPADAYLPRITERDYEAWVRMAAEANMNMLRVWGGGIYESPHFYNACDRRGIMIWQDFMFACANYPEEEWFLENVEREAACVIKSLRNHPSIVLWCGNNENQWAAYYHWYKGPYRGRKIYDAILPSAVKRMDPSRPYWPGSPFGGKDPNSEAKGDRHNWEVWSNWKDYTLYFRDKGRFLSEFGWQSAPALETVAKFGPLKELHPQHPLFEHHNKQVEGGERMARFLAGSFRTPKDLREYVHLSQMLQAEAIKAGSLHWRTRMMKTAGVLYWQLNDCWPVVSWAAVDYARRPKALYYYTRRFFAPVAVWVAVTPEGIAAYVINDSDQAVCGELSVRACTFDGAEVGCIREEVELGANHVHTTGPFKPELMSVTDPSRVYLCAELKRTDGSRIADVGFLARPKHLRLPNPGLSWKVAGSDGKVTAALSTRNLAYGVCLRLPGSDAFFEDNFLTMLPGETVQVDIIGRRLAASAVGRKLEVNWVKGGVPS